MITEARVNELLRYEHLTGKLYWRHARGGEAAGTEAGTIAECGYRIIKIDHRRYMAHRLIWLIEYGYMPRRLHRRDGNKLNNHVLNLFDVDNEPPRNVSTPHISQVACCTPAAMSAVG